MADSYLLNVTIDTFESILFTLLLTFEIKPFISYLSCKYKDISFFSCNKESSHSMDFLSKLFFVWVHLSDTLTISRFCWYCSFCNKLIYLLFSRSLARISLLDYKCILSAWTRLFFCINKKKIPVYRYLLDAWKAFSSLTMSQTLRNQFLS